MKPSGKSIFLSMVPCLVMLALFYSLAAHMLLSLGQWPDSIGERGFPLPLILHAKLSTLYFTFIYLVTVYVSPGAFIFLLAVKAWRKYTVRLIVHIVSFGLAYGCMLLAPAKFLYWWWD